MLKRRTVLQAGAMTMVGSRLVRAEEEFRIDVPAEFSGRFVAFGSQVKRGVETAVDVWKSVRGETVGGHSISVTEHDVQSNNATTVSVMSQLINSDRCHVLIGPGGSDIGAAAVPPWKQAADRPVWIVPGVSTMVVEEQIGKVPYFFHTFPWTYHYHKMIVAGLKASIGTDKKVAIIHSDGAYGRAHIKYAVKYLQDAGFNIVAQELIRENAPDYTPSLLKLRPLQPDVLYTLVQTSDAILLAKQIFSVKLTAPYLIGTFQTTLPEWKAALGDVQAYWTGVNTYIPNQHTKADPIEPKLFPSSDDWEDAWRKRWNKEPEYMEVGAYASCMLALLAWRKPSPWIETRSPRPWLNRPTRPRWGTAGSNRATLRCIRLSRRCWTSSCRSRAINTPASSGIRPTGRTVNCCRGHRYRWLYFSSLLSTRC